MFRKQISNYCKMLSALALLFAATPSQAQGLQSFADSLEQALNEGTTFADVRYRLELVDQSNFTKDATASTIRTRVGYETKSFNGFKGLVEFENVSAIGDEEYNDGGSTASDSSFPTVADPTGTELNQAFISYEGVIPDTKVAYGRQRVNLGNQRFIGAVGWRQNDQTLDSATVVNTTIPDTTLIYGWVWGINRIFGNDDAGGDLDGAIHLFDATYDGVPFGQLRGYAYLLDIDDSAANSSRTYGVSFGGGADVGSGVKALYYAEYATQSDYGNNTTSYDADYIHVNGGASYAGFTAKAGFEELGSDNGTFAFRTPMATGHKWNGWADQFLTTPANGLEDRYGLVSYKVDGLHESVDGTKLTVVYHDFSQDNGSGDYGTEWDANVSKTFLKHFSAGVKYANYDADGGSSATNDVEKIIFSLGYKFNSKK